MPVKQRHACVDWRGDLDSGQGQVRETSSGVLADLAFSRASRVQQPDGRTSPEELLATAHAQCYVMGLAHVLAHDGTPAETLHVSAECTLGLRTTGPHIIGMELRVSGKVPGIDAAAFERAARQADQLCPVSNVLRNNLLIQLHAQLEA